MFNYPQIINLQVLPDTTTKIIGLCNYVTCEIISSRSFWVSGSATLTRLEISPAFFLKMIVNKGKGNLYRGLYMVLKTKDVICDL